MPAYLEISQIGKTFTRGSATTEVLREVSLDIAKGEYISIIGHSGCGKSTLLNIVAAEMLTGGVGIGFFIWDAWNSSRLPDIFVALVYIGLVGFVLDRIVAMVANFATRGAQAS